MTLSLVLAGCVSSKVTEPTAKLYSEIYPLPPKPMYDPLPADPTEALRKAGIYLINEIEYATKLEIWIKYSEDYYRVVLSSP